MSRKRRVEKKRKQRRYESETSNPGTYFHREPDIPELREGEHEEQDEEEDVEGQEAQTSIDESSHLYVLEPKDIDDFSVEDLKEVWADKENYCGSREVAAEVLAVLEVVRGNSNYYQGWQTYINRDEITALTLPLLTRGPEKKYISVIENGALSLIDISKLDRNGLLQAWDNRPASFASIEAACKTLALLRKEYDKTRSDAWQDVIFNDEIEKMKDEIPYEGDSAVINKAEYNRESVRLLSVDERRRRISSSLVREGQQYFRKKVLENYNYTCCISGSNLMQILEAAHIVPYTGIYSNRIDNSLCLRVDLHRLFDRYLLSVEPSTSKVRISRTIYSESDYSRLEGKELINAFTQPSKYYLEQHFRTFCKREDQCAR